MIILFERQVKYTKYVSVERYRNKGYYLPKVIDTELRYRMMRIEFKYHFMVKPVEYETQLRSPLPVFSIYK